MAKQQSFDDMSWLEKMDFVRKFSKFPAITVMVFIRRRIGFRMMNPTWLLILGIAMLLTPLLLSSVAQPFGFIMVIYALAMFGLGHWHRWQRWKELCEGVHWHTFSPGISYFEKLKLPVFLKSHYRVNRWLDPAAVFVAGFLIGAVLSHALGIWIMFSALFLYVFEQDLYERALNRDLDTLDGMFMSKVQADLVKEFDPKAPKEQQQRSMDETAGIPTGLAPDIQVRVRIMQIEFRREQKAAGPDNIAPEPGDIPV